MSKPMTPPQFSDDGRWWWTGNEWVPAPASFQAMQADFERRVQAVQEELRKVQQNLEEREAEMGRILVELGADKLAVSGDQEPKAASEHGKHGLQPAATEMPQPAAEPQFSDDGRLWWTGTEWVPASQAPAAERERERQKADPQIGPNQSVADRWKQKRALAERRISLAPSETQEYLREQLRERDKELLAGLKRLEAERERGKVEGR